MILKKTDTDPEFNIKVEDNRDINKDCDACLFLL